MSRFSRRCTGVGAVGISVMLAACSGNDVTPPAGGEPGIRAVGVAGATDTIDAPVIQPLVIEVRGRDGMLASGVVVRFRPQVAADSSRRAESTLSVCTRASTPCPLSSALAIDTTDALGQATVSVRMGRVASRTYLLINAPELGITDSVPFTVSPGQVTAVRTLFKDTLVNIGASVTVVAHVVDRYGNARPEVPTLTPGPEGVVTLVAATGVVTGRDFGAQQIFASYQSYIDSTHVRVLPGGRLVVWNRVQGLMQLLNLDGSNMRTLVSGITADNGAYPRFDASGRHVLRLTSQITDLTGRSEDAIVINDTTGTELRYISSAVGFNSILASREQPDGSLLVIGRFASAPTEYAVYLVSASSAVTKLLTIPDLPRVFGAADISHDGTRIAYLASISPRLELRIIDIATGAIRVLEPDARAPRWSVQDDRIAFLLPVQFQTGGIAAVINADGTARRVYASNILYYPGFTWSPDGGFLVGGNSSAAPGNYSTRLLRLRDGAEYVFQFRDARGIVLDFSQFDWK